MQTSGDTHQEKILGTKLYLKTCAYYIEIFMSLILDLQNIIILLSKISLFLPLEIMVEAKRAFNDWEPQKNYCCRFFCEPLMFFGYSISCNCFCFIDSKFQK
jgi:hypothetical protein